jgi:hypothetical protein
MAADERYVTVRSVVTVRNGFNLLFLLLLFGLGLLWDTEYRRALLWALGIDFIVAMVLALITGHPDNMGEHDEE